MSDFFKIKTAVQNQFDNIIEYNLFKTDVSKDELWNTYLKSFPDGSNPNQEGESLEDLKKMADALN